MDKSYRYPTQYGEDDYYTGPDDNGGVHHNSTVISHALYKLYTETTLTNQQMAELLYHTLYYLPQDCTFSQYYNAIYTSAIDLNLQHIQGKLIEVFRDEAGILCGDEITSVNWFDEKTTVVGGIIYDADTNFIVPDCTVKIRSGKGNTEGSYVDINNSASIDYEYLFMGLKPGNYTAEVSHPEYETAYLDVVVSMAYSYEDYWWLTQQHVSLDPIEATIIASGTCGDNLTWVLYDTGLLTISGTGEMGSYAYAASKRAPWYSYKDQITNVIIYEGVTSVGDYAFDGCTILSDISIPNSVMRLGKHSFSGCTSLIHVYIPENVIDVGDYLFYDCENLRTVNIPDGFTKISNFMFAQCALTEIVLPESIQDIGNSAFVGCDFTEITIPESITTIKYMTFSGCSITSIVLPNSLEIIESYAFEGSGLKEIILPKNVKSIGDCAFESCWALKSVTLNDGLLSIGNAAFSDTRFLVNIIIPESVTCIGNYAFQYGVSLTSIYFMGDVPTTWGAEVAVGRTLYYISGKSGWDSPTWKAPDGTVYNTATFVP